MLKEICKLLVVDNEILQCSSPDDMHPITSGTEDGLDPGEHPPNVELEIGLALGGYTERPTAQRGHSAESRSSEIPFLDFHCCGHRTPFSK